MYEGTTVLYETSLKTSLRMRCHLILFSLCNQSILRPITTKVNCEIVSFQLEFYSIGDLDFRSSNADILLNFMKTASALRDSKFAR